MFADVSNTKKTRKRRSCGLQVSQSIPYGILWKTNFLGLIQISQNRSLNFQNMILEFFSPKKKKIQTPNIVGNQCKKPHEPQTV